MILGFTSSWWESKSSAWENISNKLRFRKNGNHNTKYILFKSRSWVCAWWQKNCSGRYARLFTSNAKRLQKTYPTHYWFTEEIFTLISKSKDTQLHPWEWRTVELPVAQINVVLQFYISMLTKHDNYEINSVKGKSF